MRIRLIAFAAVAFALPMASQGQEKTENPFKTAKVGDYTAYKMTTSLMGKDIEASVKQTVSAKNDKELTMKTVAMFMGNTLPAKETKIDLTKPYDATAAAMQGNKKGKFEKTGEGKEKIKLGDKTYDCNWIAGKVTAEANGLKIESDTKIWFSKSVPMTGIVKMEMKSQFANVLMELTGSGSEK